MNNDNSNTSLNNSSARSSGDDPAITKLLRNSYAAPTDPAYWANLEQRVLTRLRESGPVAWWAVFSEWRSAGMIAAAMALFIAGAAIVHEQQEIASMRDIAARAAVSTVFESPSEEVTLAVSSISCDKRARPAAALRNVEPIKT